MRRIILPRGRIHRMQCEDTTVQHPLFEYFYQNGLCSFKKRAQKMTWYGKFDPGIVSAYVADKYPDEYYKIRDWFIDLGMDKF